ncbi:MAG: 16S rRNA (cytidine(1402)-2'-O)-methyltransferase [Clostridia bacterium]|nr:16S rRNA (cytidine(1402)-2'-O)-methyltransferase [Clostridia bacterium]MDD4145963.1 16S rRNA (cytidine(1402)-2'-O)-methyltransferase [Clostridia bacterium]MDD4665726.1 16S rRNA (cytidine(1402)-2'-O)-methyltransferase [Clostridia bacterium]
MESKEKGTLFLVGTPIGNLKDITLRALETLQEVDLIAAEDTRQTQKLLNHYAIHKPLTSYYEHNKSSKGPWLVERLAAGQNVALVSDAGMPGISDPGEDLVKECLQKEIPLTVIPGPSAVLTALVASGLDSTGFVFAGFFPRLKKEKKKIFAELQDEKRTLIFYESPYRLQKTLLEIKEAWGDRQGCVARELTKVFEEYQRGALSELIAYWQNHPVKGEITLLIEGASAEKGNCVTPEEMAACYAELINKGFQKKEAIKETARLLGVPKREVYKLLLVK